MLYQKKISKIWADTGIKGIKENEKWNKILKKLDKKKKFLFNNYLNKKINKDSFAELKKIKKKLCSSNKEIATRKASSIAINSLLKKMPFLLGGSEDLTESNLT